MSLKITVLRIPVAPNVHLKLVVRHGTSFRRRTDSDCPHVSALLSARGKALFALKDACFNSTYSLVCPSGPVKAVRPRSLRKLSCTRQQGKQVCEDRSLICDTRRILFHSESPVPDKTCANACCTSTFASCCTLRMSSCAYSKAARSDARTTARGHLDRTDGNIVRPMKRLAAPPDTALFPSGMPRTYQHQEHGRSAAPTG